MALVAQLKVDGSDGQRKYDNLHSNRVPKLVLFFSILTRITRIFWGAARPKELRSCRTTCDSPQKLIFKIVTWNTHHGLKLILIQLEKPSPYQKTFHSCEIMSSVCNELQVNQLLETYKKIVCACAEADRKACDVCNHRSCIACSSHRTVTKTNKKKRK